MGGVASARYLCHRIASHAVADIKMPRVVSSLRRIAGSIASSTALSSPSGLAPLSFTAQRLLATHARGTALSSAPSNFFASRERKSEGLTPCGCRVHDVCLHGTTMHGTRAFSSSPADIDKAVEEINELFVEARDEIEFAGEDSETVRGQPPGPCMHGICATVHCAGFYTH